MTKPNFKEMSKFDLRAYVLQNPQDNEAFYELSDRMKATGKPITVEELEDLLKQKHDRQ